MKPIIKNWCKNVTSRDAVIFCIAIVVSIGFGIGVFYNLKKDVSINIDGKLISVRTMKNTVGEVLAQAGVDISAEDYVNPSTNTLLKKFKVNEINIKKAVPVVIIADGKETEIMTYKDTVREAIADSPVVVYPADKLEGVKLDDPITSGMKIKIVRVREEIQKEETPVPFKVVVRENNHMDKGTEKVVNEGKEGKRERLFRVILEDGKEIFRQLIKDTIVLQPIDRVIEAGTVLTHKTARGDVIRYKKVLNMRATAYTASFKDTGKHPDHPEFGITYTGIRARKGVIAVDPKVIPLGTKVYVEVAGNTPDYGYAVAADIGGAIKGDLIDLYFDDQETVDRWGCKRVKVYILLDQ